MHRWTGSALVQIMAWRRSGANAGILLIGLSGTNFSEIGIKIHNFSFMKMRLKMSSGKWRTFCPGGDEFKKTVCSNPCLMLRLAFSVHFIRLQIDILLICNFPQFYHHCRLYRFICVPNVLYILVGQTVRCAHMGLLSRVHRLHHQRVDAWSGGVAEELHFGEAEL